MKEYKTGAKIYLSSGGRSFGVDIPTRLILLNCTSLATAKNFFFFFLINSFKQH